MRKLELSPYPVQMETPEGGVSTVSYSVRDSLVNLLFSPDLRLSGVLLLKQDTLARKILDSPDPFILLEEEEYGRVRTAVESFPGPSARIGFQRNDVELIRRVLDCPEVKVQPVE